MLSSFWFAFDAIMPMLLLMLYGYWLHRIDFFDAAFVKKLNKFTLFYAVPFLMFNNVYTLDSVSDISMPLLGVVMVSIVLITILCLMLSFLLTKQKNQRGVIMQAGFRSNFAVIGIILATALQGKAGSVVAASLQAPGIIYFNVMAVICLTIFSDIPGRTISIKSIIKDILTNRLIIGLFSGVVCLCLREIIPNAADGTPVFSLSGSLPFLYSAIESLAKIASPLAMILLGAQIDFHPAPKLRFKIVAGVALRLVIVPAVGLLLAYLAHRLGIISLSPAIVSALLAFYGSPMAVVGAVMAEEMGGDAELSRQYAVWTTALSMITLFFWILILRTSGWL